jgi:hypothetical protein
VTIKGTNFTGVTAVKFGPDQRDQLHGELGGLDHRRIASGDERKGGGYRDNAQRHEHQHDHQK